jgi:hypothetical protein
MTSPQSYFISDHAYDVVFLPQHGTVSQLLLCLGILSTKEAELLYSVQY